MSRFEKIRNTKYKGVAEAFVKPCPFCGARLRWNDNKYKNSNGHEVHEMYFSHDRGGGCIFGELEFPLGIFHLGAGDARPEKGYWGEYAELWNRRADA